MVANVAGKAPFHIVQNVETCCSYQRVVGSLRLEVTSMFHLVPLL